MDHGDRSKKGKKQCSWWCAACVGQYNWTDPHSVLVIQDSLDPSEASSSGSRATTGSVRESHVCSQNAGQLGEGRQTVKIGDQEEELEGDQGGQAQVQQGDPPERGRPGRGGRVKRFGKVKQARCALSSTPLLLGAADGSHRWWTWSGTQLVRPSTKAVRERNGRTCVQSLWR